MRSHIAHRNFKKGASVLKISKARAIVAALIFGVMIVGLATHAGTGTWSAMGLDAIAAVCPLGALEVSLGSHEIMLHPLVLLLATIIAVVLVGKALCSWACPIPWIRRFLHPGERRREAHEDKRPDANRASDEERHLDHAPCEAAGEKTCGTGISACSGCPSAAALEPVGGKRDGIQLDTRHFALIGALGSAAVFGFPVFCLICPVGLTAATVVGLWHLFQFNETSWGLIIFPAVILVEVVFFRKWCSKICPIGALLSLFSIPNKTLKPSVDPNACLRSSGIDCRSCVEACPEKLDPHSPLIPECTKCGACIEACPAHAISMKILRRKSGDRAGSDSIIPR